VLGLELVDPFGGLDNQHDVQGNDRNLKRTPVLIEEDDSTVKVSSATWMRESQQHALSGNQIDTKTSGSSTEQKQVGRIGIITAVVEFVHLLSSRLLRSATVDSTDFESLEQSRPVFLTGNISTARALLGYLAHNDVQHGGELREKENLVALLEERVEKSIEQKHFPARIDQIVVDHQLVGFRVGRPVE
jgi:hypothetical protein